jgi:iron complex transport system permease protein
MTAMRVLPLAGLMLLLGALTLFLGLGVGSTGWDSVLAVQDDPLARQIVWDIRLPRSLGAWMAGALLGLAGALAQGLFRNPLADPYLLGSASGASLGVALSLVAFAAAPASAVYSTNAWVQLGLTGAAFLGAMLGVLLTLSLARGVQHTLRLLLAGVIVGVVLGAARDLITIASPDVLQAMQAFMFGSTGFIGWEALTLMAWMWAICLVLACLFSRVLDALTLGESTALSLGIALAPLRMALVGVLALATGVAVGQTGLIAFVGLAAPHLVRSLAKPRHAWLMILSSLCGGLLLMAADVMARWLIAPQELPVGVLTAVLGGGYLLWLMHRRGALAS